MVSQEHGNTVSSVLATWLRVLISPLILLCPRTWCILVLGSYAVIVEDLWKSYGRVVAVRGLSFSVVEGEVFGLIGPNGAGKTTTLRIIATLLKPSRGSVRVYGYDVVREPDRVRRIIGYLPEEAGVYDRLSGWENLLFYARIYARSSEEAYSIVREGVELSGLGDRIWDRAETYSKGMKRRLLLARTLMVKPKLAILDEPTSGLDVYAAVEVRRLIKRYVAETNSTIILSSHNMLEVEYLCDRVAFIDKGRIIAVGRPRELVERFGGENLEEAFVNAVRGSRS